MQRILLIVLCILTVGTTSFAFPQKAQPQAEKPIHKIQRVEGSKLLSNLHNLKFADSKKIPVIVTYKDIDSAKNCKFDVKVKYNHIPSVALDVSASELRELESNPNVVQIEYDEPVKANYTHQDYYGTKKARGDFGLDGKGSAIAVIDTGIDASHVDLKGRVIAWNDLVNRRSEAYDDQGHGTHVASIAAGQGVADEEYKGVAPGANLVGVKVLDANGSGSMSTVMAGIDWVVSVKDQYNIKVLNLSLGTSGSSDGKDATSMAVNRAVDAGIVAAVAAGNSGPNTKTIGSPGAAEKALTVGAMADPSQGGFFLASFSSRGPTLDGRAKPDIAAPGYQITAAKANSGNGYVTYSGTSMATPFIAGTVALLLEADPQLTPAQVLNVMKSTAKDLGSNGHDVDYGGGNVRAYEAIREAGNFNGTPPTIPHIMHGEGNVSWFHGDVWEFEVNDLNQPIAITMIMPNWSRAMDLDLYLMDEDVRTVATSLGVNRQETISFTPKHIGTYKLSVKSYYGSGDYVFDISANANGLKKVS